jgi:glycosyltransferase involved in cell wall biosynthesis
MTETSKKARILYVITKANWGGAQKYVYDLATAAEDAGYVADVACGVEGELSDRLMHAHVPVLFVRGLGRDVSIRGDLTALASLAHLMRATRPDIVHANSSKAGFIATIAARLSRVPRIIFTAHGWSFNESRPLWQRGIFALFHLITVWCADEVICVSDAVKRDAEWMSFGMSFIKNKFSVVHNGIEDIKLVEKGLARAKLAPHLTSQVWIGTLAELHPTKGLDVAIEAFEKIATHFPHTALVLMGEGQNRNSLVALAKKHHLQDRIRFCGHVPGAASLLPAVDIFLFPSRSEALGFAALEAGNASLPVIASRVGGIPEIIEDGISGLLVPVNDVDAFAAALTLLLENPELRDQLGSALHNNVLKDFSRTQMLEKTFALYSS